MHNKKKILFIQMHIPDPRTNKRIEVAKKVMEVCVICVRRSSQDIWEPYHKDVPHYTYDLDVPTSKHLIKRYFVQRSFNSRAYKKICEEKPDIIYCGGLDMLSLVCKYKRKNPNCKIYFEVADLRECFIQKPKSLKKKFERKMLTFIEEKCFPYVDRLVLTSMKFYDVHYGKLISRKKVIYAPNVPEVKVFDKYIHKNDGEFTVGFIGGIRYLEQMKMLVDAAEIANCKVIFAGAGGTNSDYCAISEYCKNKEWVRFTGKYEYNTQIAELYGSVDCVYAVYDASNPNVRIALPNKLYESVYCELPIIVSKETYLSEIVETMGIGFAVNYQSTEELVKIINGIKEKDKYKKICNNCKKAKQELVNDSWANELEKLLRGDINE